MRLAIRHTTRYHFARPVARGLQRLRLRPKTTHGQKVLAWDMHLEGARVEADFDDHNHNHTTLVSILDGATSVAVTCTGTVETADTVGIVGPHTGFMPLWCFLDQTPLTRPGPKLRALAAGLDSRRDDPLDLLHALSAGIADAVRYEIGETDATTTAEEAVAHGHGVCQDHAHVFIGAARHLGIPARYVSGYLMMNDRVDQEAGHAWAEALVPGLGWVGFDVSNRVSPDARYVRVASGRDYPDAAPVSGITFGPASESGLVVSLSVEQQTAEQ
ncbi:MAG: transglutaminase family protein [Sphingomonadales bacterium]|nr:transglutaminase family protein [Sphingomonadales bacterium]